MEAFSLIQPKTLSGELLTTVFGDEYSDDPDNFFKTPADSFANISARTFARLLGQEIEWYRPATLEDDDVGLEMIPGHGTPVWPSLDKYWDFFSVSGGVLLLVPGFWQIESQIFQQCRQRGLFVYAGSINNIAAAAEVVSKAKVEFIVANTAGLIALEQELKSKQKHHGLKGVLQILSPREDVSNHLSSEVTDVPVQKEVHLVPGYPICHQPLTFLNEQSNLFHLSEHYLWHQEGDKVYLTANATDALAVRRLAMPFALESIADDLYKLRYES